jgi:hypothetical protein
MSAMKSQLARELPKNFNATKMRTANGPKAIGPCHFFYELLPRRKIGGLGPIAALIFSRSELFDVCHGLVGYKNATTEILSVAQNDDGARSCECGDCGLGFEQAQQVLVVDGFLAVG